MDDVSPNVAIVALRVGNGILKSLEDLRANGPAPLLHTLPGPSNLPNSATAHDHIARFGVVSNEANELEALLFAPDQIGSRGKRLYFHDRDREERHTSSIRQWRTERNGERIGS